jgi:protein gp37
MAETTGIKWTDATWNPWIGCRKKTEECTFCYIPRFIRGRTGKSAFNGPQLTSESTWAMPRQWNEKARAANRRMRVFTCSLSDFFEEEADPWRTAAWQLIRECSWIDWLILTKNADRIASQLPPDWGAGYANTWLGVTVGIARSMWRLPRLLDVPATIRFVSAEPLLGPLDFRPHLDGRLHWMITGAESGAKDKRRAMDVGWVRDIDRQCREAGVIHFYKQYFRDDELIYDGMLDGEKRQAWPIAKLQAQPTAPLEAVVNSSVESRPRTASTADPKKEAQ